IEVSMKKLDSANSLKKLLKIMSSIANRLMQMVLAYNLSNLMRRLCFSEHEKPKRMHTLRTLLTKVPGRFICSGISLYFF
ncbi:MAG: hypothetical protein KAX49_14575, partial [Halanaerobiales bacterium]|nr:hypothetical protein [Halanaerobiales bacterium]